MKILLYYTFAIITQVIFLKAFFPVSETNETTSIERPTTLQDIKFNETFHRTALVDKLIFVVIDALRLDFFTPELTPFLYKTALENGCNFTVHVEAPTVTLPRVKSLTTGRVPQFIDVLLNLGATQAVSDSFLHRAVRRGKKVVFYGDNTWLKIYPKIFLRSEGVHSFFVNDFTEVDNNVTRNLKSEFEKNDWDVMILHYLGLDHIGHVYGPNSKLIPKKLAEMDAVIQNLYENTEKWKEKTAILVTGDHGMKDTGGHGGSSFSETNVPLIVLKEKCSGGFIQQVDVAPSLSVLLGVDIPSGTVGHIMTGFLEMLPIDFQNYLLLYNALVLNCDEFQEVLNEAKQFHYSFLKSGRIDDGLKAKSLYENYLVKNSEVLIKTSTQQDMNLIVLCLIVLIFCLLKIVSFDNKDVTDLMLLLLLLCCSAFYFTASIALMIVLIIKITIRTSKKLYKLSSCTLNTILTISTIIQLFALTSSSFIENEEYIWYFFLSTFLICATFSNTKSLSSFCKFFLAATLFRFLRNLDANTYNWLLALNFSDWFVKEENSSHVQPFFIFSLILVLVCCVLYTKSAVVTLLNVFGLINIYVFKCFYVNNVFLGRLIWAIIALNVVLNFYNRESFVNSWLLITTLLLREYNVILLPACIFLSELICKTQEDIFVKALLHFWLGNALYFCQGHTNSLASVNVSVGYIGLQDYVPAIVFSQVLCHTYALPVLTQLLLFKNCQNNPQDCWSVLIVVRLLFLIVVNVVTVIQRNHLFIWSVFSPKLLIESSHAAVLLVQLIIWFIAIKLFKKYKLFFIVFLQKK